MCHSLTRDKAKAIPQLAYRIHFPEWSREYTNLVSNGAKYGQQYAIWRSEQANPRYLVEFERPRLRPIGSTNDGGKGDSGSANGEGGGANGEGDAMAVPTSVPMAMT